MKKFLIILLLLGVFCNSAALADVYTTEITDGFADCVYVAGDPDAYPVEFYDEQQKAYRGIIPDMLAEISELSGIDFVYINGNGRDRIALGENLQAEIISASAPDESLPYYKDYIELLSYDTDGETVRVGLIFTSQADDATISAIETARNGISANVKNGIYLSYTIEQSGIDYLLLTFLIVSFFLLAAAVVLLILRIKRMRKESAFEKMTDDETGMGNLQFFKHHFRHTVSDVSRTLYYVAYIVLDSSYLRSYHGDSSFDDVLRYTASVLSEHSDDREIPARITENGFAFAFKSTNDEDAKKRLTEIMHKLNSFENMKEKENKIVFHSAAYHLTNTDKNCEILLFNLRKNCTGILGTEKQVVICDTRSMNAVQEEKKITENILEGFEKNEFKMYLQFIVDNKTKNIVSAEALSRWDSHEKGLLSPGKYIKNLELAGLISKHDFYMFDLACRQLEKWKGTSLENITISCNFTRITLSEESFIDKLNMISSGYTFDKSKIAIEITEDAMEKNTETATRNVANCKNLGFMIYLDDLGSGYTSLANLCDYPIDVVKIDRDILLKTEKQRGKDLFSGVISLAHSLNIKVLCEGVETQAQDALVSASDCDYIQGWHYSKPLPMEECESFVENYTKKIAQAEATASV